MTDIHPTTIAIVAGLREQTLNQNYLAMMVKQLIQETALIDAGDIANAGLAGWDLGYRQQGKRFELTARSRDDPQFEMLITAMIDRGSSVGWSYHWLVTCERENTRGRYPNGTATSFNKAIEIAAQRISEIRNHKN